MKLIHFCATVRRKNNELIVVLVEHPYHDHELVVVDRTVQSEAPETQGWIDFRGDYAGPEERQSNHSQLLMMMTMKI